MSSPNRTNTQAHDGQIIAGITKNLQNAQTPLALGGQSFTPASLIALFQSRIDAANQVAAAKAQWVDLGKKYATLNVTADLVARALKQYVMNVYGATSPVLADFGFTAAKRTPLSVAEQTQAIAKRRATRKARNTLGKKQKAAIKGDVTGVTVTPVTAPTTPAPVASPAPAAPAPAAVHANGTVATA
jgi:hypothetical protein